MKGFIKVIKALSDPNRAKLVKMLQKRTRCVRAVHAALGIAQPTVSKNLNILEDAGLVDRRKEGLYVNYSLSDGGSSPYATNLPVNMMHWFADAPKIHKLFKRKGDIRRENAGPV